MAVKIIEKSTELKLPKGGVLQVGFFSEATYQDGKSVAMVAFENEFGTTKIPPRPFMRNAIENKANTDKLSEMFKILVNKKTDFKQILEQLGIQCVKMIQTEITDGNFEKNAPSTIKQKGSSRPLIDTGTMRKSVTYRAVMNK